MRLFSPVAAVALLVVGCAQSPKPETVVAPDMPVGEAAPSAPTFELASSVEGKIVSVRPDLRYVVIDFSFSRLPQSGQTMGVYRNADRVGEVRIARNPTHAQNGAMVADIKKGGAQVGDFVRAD